MSSKRKTAGLVLFPAAKRSRQHNLVPLQKKFMAKRSSMREGVINGVAKSGTDAPEIKNYDNNIAAASVVTGTPYVASLCSGIAEGTSDAQRVGQKILLKSVDIEMNVVAVPGASVGNLSPPCPIDVFVVWDKQPNAAQAAASTIFASSATNLTFLNTQNTERFVVLRRHSMVFDTVEHSGEVYKVHVPLDVAVKFPDANTFPTTNDILVCALSPNAVSVNSTTATIAYVARVKFTDA